MSEYSPVPSLQFVKKVGIPLLGLAKREAPLSRQNNQTHTSLNPETINTPISATPRKIFLH